MGETISTEYPEKSCTWPAQRPRNCSSKWGAPEPATRPQTTQSQPDETTTAPPDRHRARPRTPRPAGATSLRSRRSHGLRARAARMEDVLQTLTGKVDRYDEDVAER